MIDIKLRKKLFAVSGPLELDVVMTLQQGEFAALYGASGAGKTSILRMIAGLVTPDEGKIVIGDKTWFDRKTGVNWRTQQRDIGIVFQDYALFPNMTVRENIAYALPPNENNRLIDEMVELMELGNLQSKKPQVLSGGQRQRVAVARAIIRKPSVLLLDEPFTALDTSLRLRMQEFVLQIHKQFQLTTILVSHDLTEVVRLAERVFHLEDGKIIKSGLAREVVPFHHFQNLIKGLEDRYRAG